MFPNSNPSAPMVPGELQRMPTAPILAAQCGPAGVFLHLSNGDSRRIAGRRPQRTNNSMPGAQRTAPAQVTVMS